MMLANSGGTHPRRTGGDPEIRTGFRLIDEERKTASPTEGPAVHTQILVQLVYFTTFPEQKLGVERVFP
jgi:hypothetical protein